MNENNAGQQLIRVIIGGLDETNNFKPISILSNQNGIPNGGISAIYAGNGITVTYAGTAASVAVSTNGIDNTLLAQMPALTAKANGNNTTFNAQDIPIGNGKALFTRTNTLAGQYVNQVLSKAANYPLTQDDNGSTILCTAALTITLPNPATVGNGWWVCIKKTVAAGSDVTIARNGLETIDGRSASDVLKAQYAFAIYITDGTNWHVHAVNDYLEKKNGTSTNCPASGTTAVLDAGAATLSIPPGEWQLSYSILVILNGATALATFFGFIGTTNDGTTTGVDINNICYASIPTASQNSQAIAIAREIFTATASRYIKLGMGTYATATPQAQYTFSARRVG